MTTRKFTLIFALILALALPVLAVAAGPVTVTMKAQNNSGESGTATLTDQGGGKTQVVVNLTGAPAGVSQPAHIHTGTCANLGGVKYPLTNVMDGKSTTTVDVSLDDLMKSQFAVNVHKSGTEISVYVSCGEIPMAAAATVMPKSGAPLLGIVVALGAALLGAGVVLRRRFA